MNRYSSLRFVNNQGTTTTSKKTYRPGKHTYSEAVTGERKAVIFTTSMMRGTKIDELNERYMQGHVTIHRFPGGKARHMKNQIATHLQEELPDVAFIQCGGNDIPVSQRTSRTMLEIANHIMDMVQECKDHGVERVVVSNVLPREPAVYQLRRKELNDILRSICELQNVFFLDNDRHVDMERRIVLSKHIDYDGVHFNEAGSNMFRDNVAEILNSIC